MAREKLFGCISPVTHCCGCIDLSGAIAIFILFQAILGIINLALGISISSDYDELSSLGKAIGVILIISGFLYFIMVISGCRARGNSDLAGEYLAWWKTYYCFQMIGFIVLWALYIKNISLRHKISAGLIVGCIISIIIEIVLFTHYLSVVHSWFLQVTDKNLIYNEQPYQNQQFIIQQQPYQQPGQYQINQPPQFPNQQFQNQQFPSQQFPNQQFPNQQFPNQQLQNQQINQQFTNQNFSNQQFPNQQFPNQQFPNQQFPNQQFPNQQFPNQQFPIQDQQMNQQNFNYPKN